MPPDEVNSLVGFVHLITRGSALIGILDENILLMSDGKPATLVSRALSYGPHDSTDVLMKLV